MKVKITTQENMNYYNCAKNTEIEISLEDYVAAVVSSEVGAAPLEAAKAQAVAARTFAIRRGVLNGKTISDSASVAQAFRAPRIDWPVGQQAAQETMCQILEYNGSPISAVYSGSNGGHTVSSKEKWGTVYPYLIAQEDPWDKKTKNGHGVGLSQEGARVAALWGHSYKEILNFYYPHTKIKLYAKAVFAQIRIVINKIMARL